MKCKDAQEKMDSWVDEELSEETAKGVEKHLASCKLCSQEAFELKALAGMFSAVPATTPSPQLKSRTLVAFKSETNQDSLAQLWQTFGWAMRTLTLGGAMGGLIFGVLLGNNLCTDVGFPQNYFFDFFFYAGDLFPPWV